MDLLEAISNTTKTILTALLSHAAVTAPVHARDDIQSWNWISIYFWENSQHRAYLCGDHRIDNDMGKEKLWIAGIGHRYLAHKHLQHGLGYLYMDIRNVGTNAWTQKKHLEFEFNPKDKLTDTLGFHLRNRLETRFLENQDTADYRSRHRLQLARAVAIDPVCKLFVNTEAFYVYSIDKLNEIRRVPFGTGLTLRPSARLNLFYMIQSKRTQATDNWNHNHIVETQLISTF